MACEQIIKQGISSLLSGFGLFAALERYRLKDKAFVLMYHRVLNPEELESGYVQPGMFVTSSSFREHVLFLKKNYRILFLEELIDKIEKKENTGGCCAITFDDGWLDNYRNAFPILKMSEAPATIFLASSFVGTTKPFWPEELCWYLEKQMTRERRQPDSVATASFFRFQREIEKFPSDVKELFLDNAIEVLKSFSPDDRKEVLATFRSTCDCRELPRQMLNWREVEQMCRSGLISFGAHTAGHEILDQLPLEKAAIEVAQSRKDIERYLPVKVNTFAYPNGNYDQDITKLLRDNGFKGAVTTNKGYVGLDTPQLEIPRIGMHEDVSCTLPLFRARILLGRF